MQAALQDLTKQRTVPNVFIGATRVALRPCSQPAFTHPLVFAQVASTSAAMTVRRALASAQRVR